MVLPIIKGGSLVYNLINNSMQNNKQNHQQQQIQDMMNRNNSLNNYGVQTPPINSTMIQNSTQSMQNIGSQIGAIAPLIQKLIGE